MSVCERDSIIRFRSSGCQRSFAILTLAAGPDSLDSVSEPRRGARRSSGAGVLLLRGAVLVLLISVAWGCQSRRAERMLAEAQRQGAAGDTAAAAETLKAIVRDYPETRAADSARALLPTYEALQGAVTRDRTREAEAILLRAARAVERFKEARRTLPLTLLVLVPDQLDTVPVDPWGREIAYTTHDGRYALSCLGADGSFGGAGEDRDLRIENGEFVASPGWAEQ